MFHFPYASPSSILLLAAHPEEPIGVTIAAELIWFLMFLGALKCLQLMRRSTTSALCVSPLFLYLFGVFLSALTSFLKKSLWPQTAMVVAILLVVLWLVGIVLGVVGLALYNRGRFHQGRKQAVWGILLSLLTLILGCVTAFQTYHAMRPERSLEGEGEQLIELKDANCKFSAPVGHWVQIKNPKVVNANATAILRSLNPNITAVLVAESIEVESKALLALSKANMQRVFRDAIFSDEKSEDLYGLKWETVHVKIPGAPSKPPEVASIWGKSVAGFSYQWIISGQESDRDVIFDAARKIVSSFAILDTSRTAVYGPLVQDAKAEVVGFRTKLAALGWNTWEQAEDGAKGAALTATHGKRCYLLADTIPLWRDGENLGDIQQAFYSPFEMLKNKEVGTETEPFQMKGADEAVKFSLEFNEDKQAMTIRGIVARSAQRAYFFLLWRPASLGGDLREMDDAIESIEILADRTALPTPHEAEAANRQALILNQLGLLHSKRADWQSALGAFRLSFKLAPARGLTLQNLAYSMEMTGDIQGAHDLIEQSHEPLAAQAPLRANFARLKGKLGDNEGACEQYETAFAKGLRDEGDLLEYLNLLLRDNKGAAAVKIMDDYVAKGATPKTRRWQAEAYQSAGNAQRALEIYDELLAKPPFDPLSAYGLGETANDESQYDRAAAAAASLLKSGNDNARTRMIEGWSLFGRKSWRDAKVAFEKARVFSPDDAGIASALTRVSAMLGEGDNSSVKTPIAPVPLPAALNEAIAKIAKDTALPVGASACYLLRASAYHFEPGKPTTMTQYRRVKILTQAGVADFGTLTFPFDPLSEKIHVNRLVVTDESGKVTTAGLPEEQYVVDLSADSAEGTHNKVLRVVVAALKPGCTVEITVTRQDRSDATEFSYERCICTSSIPTQAEAIVLTGDIAHIRAVPTAAMEKLATIIESKGSRVWLLHQPPVWKRESHQPSVDSYLPVLRLGSAKSDWAELGRDYLKQIDSQLKPDAKTKALVAEITGHLKNDDEKIRALTTHVQRNVTYQAIEFGRRARIPKPAERVLASRYGDCKDQALLLCQLLKIAGVPAQLALVHSSNDAEPTLPSLDQFNHMIVRIPGQKAAFIDSTNTALPAGKLPPELFHRQALVLYPDKPRLEALPERGLFPTESLVCEREIAVAASGEMTVRETLRITSYFAMGWRTWATDIEPSERLAALQNVPRDSRWHVEKFTAEGLDDNFAELVLTFHYTMPATSAALVSPAIWERDYLEVPFLKERRFPLELLHPMRIESHVKLQLPRAADAQALKALAKSGESEFGKWKLDAKGEPGNAKAVTISFDYQAPAINLPATRYGEWQTFRSRAIEAWQQPLKLE